MCTYIYISTCRRKQRPAGLPSGCSDLGGESGSLVTWFFLQQPPRRLFLIHILSLEHLWRLLRQRGNRDVFFVVFPSGQGAGTPRISFSFRNTELPGGFPLEMPAQCGCVVLPLPHDALSDTRNVFLPPRYVTPGRMMIHSSDMTLG